MKISSVSTILQNVNTQNRKPCSKTHFGAKMPLEPQKALILSSKTIGVNFLPADYAGKPCLYIDKLVSFAKGGGTEAVKSVVRRSLALPNYDGRVCLLASGVGGEKITAIGFYYKLGFRSIAEKDNEICEAWIKAGGKREDAPYGRAYMYLPKENIEKCLNYPEAK